MIILVLNALGSFLQTNGHGIDRFPSATISIILIMLLSLSLILKCFFLVKVRN